MNEAILSILEKGSKNNVFTLEEIERLLLASPEESTILYQYANKVREKNLGNEVHLRGIIEFSNYCKQNCIYCGLRKNNKNINRYRLNIDEILKTAQEAIKLGYRTIVLQSGEDGYYSPQLISELVKKIKQFNIAITLSLGEYDYATYKLWRKAGADRYLLKHETADPILYRKIRPGKKLSERIQCQKWLKQLGYQLGSGCMVGIPGQTINTLAKDLLLMQSLEVDMAGIGPFIPHPATPFANSNQGTLDLTLKMIAIARILMPFTHLPATTSLGTININGRKLALQVGGNVIMPNVSPMKFRKDYQIYPNKIGINDQHEESYTHVTNLLHGLGRKISTNYGHSPNYKKFDSLRS